MVPYNQSGISSFPQKNQILVTCLVQYADGIPSFLQYLEDTVHTISLSNSTTHYLFDVFFPPVMMAGWSVVKQLFFDGRLHLVWKAFY